MIRISFLIVIISSWMTCFAQDEIGSFLFEGKIRSYNVYLPQNYNGIDNLPVVFNLHGYWGSIHHIAGYTKMHEYADTMGFIVVYPSGSIAPNGASGWNNGLRDNGQTDTTSNDLGFISVLIDTLTANYSIDLSRIYSCGFSMGGVMTYRLAFELGYRFAAIASVAGTMNDVIRNLGIPIRPMPVLQFHGTNDRVATYDGLNVGNSWGVEETINFWADFNNCSTPADTTLLPDINENDGCTVEKISYLNCSVDSRLILYKILYGGHSWPGSTDIGSFSSEGNRNMDINASLEILKFFKNFTNPLANTAISTKWGINPNYLSTYDDSLYIKAETYNPDGHEVNVYAMMCNMENNIQDSIQLFDDGLHNDNVEDDNIWANAKTISEFPEDIYTIKLKINDLSYQIKHLSGSIGFTNAGPVVYSNHDIQQHDDSTYSMKVSLKNNSANFTVPNVKAVLSTNDTSVTEILANGNPQNYPDIEPGQSVQCSGTWGYIFYAKNNPETVKFKLDIYSEGFRLWTDSIAVLTENEDELPNLPKAFRLHQNYPNPFNPSTTIKYSIPNQSNVTLKVYDVLGSEVATLINKEQPLGHYEVEFDGSSVSRRITSGIYFYRLQVHPANGGVYPAESGAGDFVETKKMILLK